MTELRYHRLDHWPLGPADMERNVSSAPVDNIELTVVFW